MRVSQWLSWPLLLGLVAIVRGCPIQQGCSCELSDGKQIINCRYQNLQTVPTITPSTDPYYELTLAHNNITSLGDDAFQGLNIQVLDLSENPIASISSHAFRGLETSLTQLVLHVNSMSSYPQAAVTQLTKLQKLTLRGFSLNTLPDNSFTGLSQLTWLTLDTCKLSALSQPTVSPIKDKLQYLNLQGNLFTSLPAALSQLSLLNTLVLAKNQMTSLPSAAFSANTHLLELDLSHTGLNNINSAAFEGLHSLLKLNLQNNKLPDSQLSTLSSLQSLTDINLSYNSLISIPDGVFSQLSHLRNMKITNNQISALKNRTFEGLSGVVTLDLTSNGINSIQAGAFNPLSSIESLELDHQTLVDALSPSTFAGIADTLRNLSMKETGFHSGKWSSIAYLQSLTILDLSTNNLRSLPDLGMSQFTKLQNLDLSHNQISDLTQRKMYGPQNSLKTINLNDNDIVQINKCVFQDFHLERISLTSNPLKCDCQLKWLRQWVQNNYDLLNIQILDWKCAEPAEHRDVLFGSLSVDQFVCNPAESEPVCETITVTTSTQRAQTSITTPGGPVVSNRPLLLTVSNITHSSCVLTWSVLYVSDIQGFLVEYSVFEEQETLKSFDVDADVRSTAIDGLEARTVYVMCVNMKSDSQQTACIDVETLANPSTGQVTGAATAAILGGVLGGVAFLVVIIIVAFLLYRRQKEKEWGGGGGGGAGGLFHTEASGTLPSAATRPQMGYNSKRFSRAKTLSADADNIANKDFESKMANLTKEERDQILNFLTNSGGSTLSMISSGSSQRYVPDLPPRPAHLEGYLNPISVKSDESSESIEDHVYSEIGNEYSDIGLTEHYDNNNLRKHEPTPPPESDIPPIPDDSYV